MGIIDEVADLVENRETGMHLGALAGGMVLDQPGVFVQAHHAHVGHDAPLGLIDEVARDGRVLGV